MKQGKHWKMQWQRSCMIEGAGTVIGDVVCIIPLLTAHMLLCRRLLGMAWCGWMAAMSELRAEKARERWEQSKLNEVSERISLRSCVCCILLFSLFVCRCCRGWAHCKCNIVGLFIYTHSNASHSAISSRFPSSVSDDTVVTTTSLTGLLCASTLF